jgi:peroxiredoxin
MIKLDERIPEIKLQTMNGRKVVSKNATEFFAGKKTLLFAVPGAFTPTCSEQHLPGYMNCLFDLRKAGVEQVACISVNDAFVMNAWAKDQNITDEILMLADGSAEFSKAMGLDLDLSKFGFGIRCSRYAMLIDDNVVKLLKVEKGGALKVSKAEVMLEALATL